MRLASVCSCVVLLTVVACGAHEPSTGDLDGKWGWELNGNPGGSSYNLTLETSGQRVTGHGAICGIGPNCNPGGVTITGDHTPAYGPFQVTVAGPAGFSATYSGHFVGPDQLQGTWTTAGHSFILTLNRCGPSSMCW